VGRGEAEGVGEGHGVARREGEGGRGDAQGGFACGGAYGAPGGI
jgi:hypothetical protein